MSSLHPSRASFRGTTDAASTHLDVLRGVAAIGVLLSHWRDCFFVDYAGVSFHSKLLSLGYLYTGVGHQWVVVFFVLSGYLVGGSVLRQIAKERWEWTGYAGKRLSRLYTVLIPALVLGGLIDLAGLHLFGTAGIYGGHTGAHEIAGNASTRLTLPVALGNYAFLQDIHLPVLGTNGPLWSLSYEFWYYVVFPLLSVALWYKRSALLRIASAILAAAVLCFVGWDVALLGLVWLMGVSIHWLPASQPSTGYRRRLWIYGSLAGTTMTVAICKGVHFHPHALRHFVPADLVLGAMVTLLVYSLANFSSGSLSALYVRFAKQIARSSYTLYLVHVPALVFLAAWRVQDRWQPDARHLLMGVAILAAVYMYAQVIYYCFERNTDLLRRSIEACLVRARLAAKGAMSDPPRARAVPS